MRESKSARVAARRVAARRARGRAVVPGNGVERWTIHGGTSGIGIAACAWLDAREVRDIVLVGRSGRTRPPKSPAERAATAAAFDPRRETAVTMRRADVSTAEESAMTRRPREGLVHASGVLSDASLARLTAGATRSVFAPKSESARRVVAAVSRRDVRASLFFSSLAVVGSPGQGNYAAANADMDARVARTHRAGVPAVAIRWGAWAEIGMAATRRRLRAFPAANATGAGAIPPDVGAACLLALVRASRPEALVARVDWNIFAKNGAKDDGIFREMISDENSAETKERIKPAMASTTSPRDVLASPSSARPRLPSSRGDVGRYESIVDAIADLVESCVGARVPADQPLMDAGLDSLAATELASAVAARFGVEIPGTFAFDHPNVDAMSRFVGSRVGVFAEDATTRPEDRFGIETEAPSKGFRSRAVSDSSVVVHVAAVASARSDANTNRRADDARVAPESRVLVDDGDIGSGSRVASSPTNPVAFGVFLPDVDRFDASFFGVGAEEATQMDPQHRLLLHCAGSAVDDVASNLRERDVRSFGVFAGSRREITTRSNRRRETPSAAHRDVHGVERRARSRGVRV